MRNPIVDFTLFRNGSYFGASAAAFAVVGSYWAVMFFQPQYLQDARGHSALLSGLLILPVTAPMVFISPFSAFHALQAGGDSFTDAIAGSTWVTVGLCIVGGLLTWVFVRDPERPGLDPRWRESHRRVPCGTTRTIVASISEH